MSFDFDSAISDYKLKYEKCLSMCTGLKKIVVYALYAVLVLLLLILLMVTGIKCTSSNTPVKLIH